MPSSFSRFLSDQELERVRQLYLESLEEKDPEEAGTMPVDKGAAAETQEGTAGDEARSGDGA